MITLDINFQDFSPTLKEKTIQALTLVLDRYTAETAAYQNLKLTDYFQFIFHDQYPPSLTGSDIHLALQGVSQQLGLVPAFKVGPIMIMRQDPKASWEELFKKLSAAREILKKELSVLAASSARFDPNQLINANPLTNSTTLSDFTAKMAATGQWLNWRCACCGRFLDGAPRLKSQTEIEDCYDRFKASKYFTCAKCKSDNLFIVQEDKIIFCTVQSLKSDPAKYMGRSEPKIIFKN